MTFGESVFQRVTRRIQHEFSAGEFQTCERLQTATNDTVRDGELVWIAQCDASLCDKEKALRTSRGRKHLLTEEESNHFAGTPYESGFSEFVYEGGLKQLNKVEGTTDLRGSMRQGRGTLFYPNGTLYVGNWHGNKRQGVGCISSSRGYSYVGEWHKDAPNGKGYEVFPCHASIDAHYENGYPQGEGTMLYNPKFDAYRYEGEWKNGERHGRGIIFYTNGDTFACTFSHGKRHGRGVTTQTVNGRVIQYETSWEGNKLISGPKVIPKPLRTPKPVSSIPYRTKGYLTAVDIRKWTTTGDAFNLTFEDLI